MVGNMTFQSTGKSGRAFFLACSQNGLFFIPLVLILPHFIGVLGIQLANPFGYIISAIIATPLLISLMNHMKHYK